MDTMCIILISSDSINLEGFSMKTEKHFWIFFKENCRKFVNLQIKKGLILQLDVSFTCFFSLDPLKKYILK